MKTYRAGQRVRVDLFICGFPRGVVRQVIRPGTGRHVGTGLVRVRLVEPATGYRAGEIIEVSTTAAVPLRHIRVGQSGQYRIDINYEWAVSPPEGEVTRAEQP